MIKRHNNLIWTRKDYYKPAKNFNVFNNNYNEYESNGDKSKVLSIKKYFDQIKPYLIDIINNLKNQGEWKIHFEAWLNAWKSNNSFDYYW